MSAHTPGPWNYSGTSVGKWNGIRNTVLVDTYGPEGAANARLIAAAPRMLTLLAALDEYGYHATDPNEIKDAVNEARAILRDVEEKA